MKTIKVLLLSDGKPGHVTQSQGLINVLEKDFVIKRKVIKAKPKFKILNRLIRYFVNNNSLKIEWLFGCFYACNYEKISNFQPDLILSTGGDTCGANAFLARKYRCKNLFLGSLRGFKPNLFTAVITTVPMPDVENSILLDVTPTLVDTEKLAQSANEFIFKHQIKQKKLWVMVIGGKGSGYEFSQDDWEGLVSAMEELATQHNIRWLLTTSRRTGIENEKLIKSLLLGKDHLAYAVYYNEYPEKIMSAYLGAGKIIFCTEDSTSMVSEAVVSQKKVITLRGKTKNINQGHFAVIKRFELQGYIYRVKISELNDLNLNNINHAIVDVTKNYKKIIGLIS